MVLDKLTFRLMLFRANAGAARGLTGRRLANDRLRDTATSGTQAAASSLQSARARVTVS